MMVTQTIDLSMTPAIQVLPEVYASQYDNGIRRVVFNLYTDDTLETPYSVDGMSAIVQGTKPDGNAYAQSATAAGNTVTVTIGTQMVAVEGITPSEIVLRNGSQRIGSINFLLMVEPAGIRDDAVVSDSEIPPYIDAAAESAEAAAASQAAAASSETNAAASAEAAEDSATTAASDALAAGTSKRQAIDSAAAALASQTAAATSEANAAASAESSEYWAKQSMEGKTLATLPDVELTDPLPNKSALLVYDPQSAKWKDTATPLPANLGGTGNSNGLIQKSNTRLDRTATIEADGIAAGAHSHVGGEKAKAFNESAFSQGFLHPTIQLYPEKQKFQRSMPTPVEGFLFGYAPSSDAEQYGSVGAPIHYGENFELTSEHAGYGCSATIGNTAVATLNLVPGAIYLLLCNSFTTATGALYGATARMISCLPTETGTPNSLSLGQTTNAPATIAAAANHVITIANSAASRMTQFTLIRVA